MEPHENVFNLRRYAHDYRVVDELLNKCGGYALGGAAMSVSAIASSACGSIVFCELVPRWSDQLSRTAASRISGLQPVSDYKLMVETKGRNQSHSRWRETNS